MLNNSSSGLLSLFTHHLLQTNIKKTGSLLLLDVTYWPTTKGIGFIWWVNVFSWRQVYFHWYVHRTFFMPLLSIIHIQQPLKFTAKSTKLWYLFSLILGNMQFKSLPRYWLSWLMYVVPLVHLQTNAGIVHDTKLKTEPRHTASLAATAWLTHCQSYCCMYITLHHLTS